MSQEIDDLKAAQVANEAAIQAAKTAIAGLVTRNAELASQVAALTASATDAALIPPVTAAIAASTNELTAAVGAVPVA